MTESTINRINYHIAKAKAEILDEMIAEKKAEIERLEKELAAQEEEIKAEIAGAIWDTLLPEGIKPRKGKPWSSCATEEPRSCGYKIVNLNPSEFIDERKIAEKEMSSLIADIMLELTEAR